MKVASGADRAAENVLALSLGFKKISVKIFRGLDKFFKGRKEGSPIRILTNIDPALIKYPSNLSNYPLCKP